MKRILITGAGGFLGSHIAKLLSNDNDNKIFNLSRTHHLDLDDLGVETIRCDISKKDQVESVDLSSFDVIFHVAAIAGIWGKQEDFYNVNFIGTKNLVDHAKNSGVKSFIYTSTPSVVFGDSDIEFGDEKLDYPSEYYTDYARTKSLAEKYVKDHSDHEFKSVSLRPHLIWGPGDPHLIPRVIEKARLGKLKMVGEGENLVDIIFVENAARAHVKAWNALEKNPDLSGNAYFIGQERPVKLWEFINTILEKKNIRPVSGYVSFQTAFYIGWLLEILYRIFGIYKPEPPMTRFVALQLAKSHYFSHEKAREEIGYNPEISIEEGLERTFKTSLS